MNCMLYAALCAYLHLCICGLGQFTLCLHTAFVHSKFKPVALGHGSTTLEHYAMRVRADILWLLLGLLLIV
jgi:hypothetical protein